MASIDDLIRRLRECSEPDWRLDDEVNNTTGQVRRVGRLTLGGRSSGSDRYFGPKADPNGLGVHPPKPTKDAASRAKAIRALTKLRDQEASDGR